jgi:NAD(P)-dependent dehydrogenase (short-subunit alcohol dehydrogenase family)
VTASSAGESQQRSGVVVTGGASSVGRVIAEQFAARGDAVHVIDADSAALTLTLEANRGMSGSVGNVSSIDDVERMFADAHRALGQIDVLVNGVGIAGPHAALEDTSYEDWQTTIDVNLGGMFYCMRQVVPGMKSRRGGAIVNFSSASSKTGLPMRTPYVVSKRAVEGLTYNAARELGPFGIRCNAILPGAINNDRFRFVVDRNARARGVSAEEMEATILRYIAMRTKVEPEEVAATVLFLCSRAGCKITGQLIEVSGLQEWEE